MHSLYMNEAEARQSPHNVLKGVELRKLPAGYLCSIIDILEIDNDWKKLMSLIPKNPRNKNFEPKYNTEHMKLIEDGSKTSGRKCAEILLDEWSTSGKIRPTLETLKEVAVNAGIYRAADVIALMLHEDLPRRPKDGPAAAVDYNLTDLLRSNVSIKQKVDQIGQLANDYFNKSTCKLKTSGTSNYGKQSTAQMKPSIDINFSKNINSAEIPKLSELQSLSNKTTAQLKSESDLERKNKWEIPEIKVNESLNIPRFSAILSQEHSENSRQDSVSRSTCETDTNSNIHSQESELPDVYQLSLPNISLVNLSPEDGIDSSILFDTNLIHFSYTYLKEITNNFSEELQMSNTGLTGFIGSGGFGEVFVGVHHKHGALAVKKFHHRFHKPEIEIKIFNNEVKYLSKFRHKNIVPIIGYSKDGPGLCIVCEFISGGSLEQKLADKVLTEKQRIYIMMGTAEGLKYLHSYEKPIDDVSVNSSESSRSSNSKKNNFVHGDVKSANILLTTDCVPKLCDFGLVKQYDTTCVTRSPMGTHAYMAPESFSGTITQKLDIYSYGIVLLELLTGLKPIINDESEYINIKLYVQENSVSGNIDNLLDSVIEKWTKANEIYDLAQQCLKHERKNRPSIEQVCDVLNQISNE